MKPDNISLPYPILSYFNDDIIPTLQDDCINVEIDSDSSNYYFDFLLKYENDDIKQLIADGFAEYSCEVDCVKTVLRKSFGSKEPNFRITLSRKDVNDKIWFNTYISVIRPIKGYKNKNFNEDYGDNTFDMEPGDILAYFPPGSHNVNIKYDKLQSAGSFMTIREGTSEYTDFNFSNSKIEILLPKELFQIYNSGVGKSNAEIIHASLAFNALTCALGCINNHRDCLWAETILYRVEHDENLAEFRPDDSEADWIIDSPHKLAMALLKDPFNRMLVSLNNNNNPKDDE